MNKNFNLNTKQVKLENGTLKVDNKVLASIIALATKEINGVSDLGQSFENKVKNFISKSNVPGVDVKFAENGNLLVNVYVKIFHGFSVPDISYKIQENIKNSVAAMISSPVKTINVFVTGVDFQTPKTQSN